MGRTTPLRQELKRAFFPYLAGKGFTTDMRRAPQFFTFRKIDVLDFRVCDIQWDKYGGPRFAVNFGKCGADGADFRGQHVPPADVFPSHAYQWGRLIPGPHWTTRGWFRQERPILQRVISWSRVRAPEYVVQELMTLFREVEDFWNTGRVGRHIRLVPSPFHVQNFTLRASEIGSLTK